MTTAPNDHARVVARILERELGAEPTGIRRMTRGIANEVYAASLADRDLIVRMNRDTAAMRGAEGHIALFRSLGVTVPEILAADYSKRFVPYAYQVQGRLAGRDLGEVIAGLDAPHIEAIARQIADISRRLATLPTNGKFGWSGGAGEASASSWLDVMRGLQQEIERRASRLDIVKQRYTQAVEGLLQRHRTYFREQPSTFYYDDMNSKNVMVDDGKFVGIVDLDTVVYGDPLEGIGRIEASWYGTPHGTAYTAAVVKALGLDPGQRQMVRVYAVVNRICWLSELGLKFNENTTDTVDPDALARDERIVDKMLADLEA